MNKIIIETKPILIKFEIVVFQGNLVIVEEGLFDIKICVYVFEVLDDGILGVVRVEIGVGEDIFNLLGFTIELGGEFFDVGGVF